jgi:hypothetical protein
MNDMQQRLRIQSAGHSNQDSLTAFEQFAVLDGLFNALEQIGHAVMLLHWRDGARAAVFQYNNWRR